MPAETLANVEIGVQKEYYDRYWSARSAVLNSHELLRLAKILEGIARISERPGGDWTICDLGCGIGWLSNELVKFGQVTGVDLSAEGVQIAGRHWPAVTFIAHDILTWKAPQPFDLVISSEVAEHVPDKQRFRDAILAATRPGGHFIITTPNERMRAIWDASKLGAQLIEQWSTPGELRELFGAGATVLWHQTFLFDFAYTRSARVLSAPKLLNVITRLGLLPIYNALRETANAGLYQVLLGRKHGAG